MAVGSVFPIGGENYMRSARPFSGRLGQKSPTTSRSSFKTAYPAAVDQTGEDYSSIMGGYQDILKEPQDSRYGNIFSEYQNLLNKGPITPERVSYSQTPDVASSMAGLKDLSTTGGLGEEGIRDLRARGISPIRSVYANAQRNMDRQKSLSGGYSPNYNATSSRMARELSEQVAGATTDVNARIAEMVQRGKLSAAPQYAQFAGQEAGAERDINKFNADAAFRAQEFGGSNKLAALRGMEGVLNQPDKRFEALRGMTSLYGTTPALASTFGNQALSAAQLQQQATQSAQNTASNALSTISRTPARKAPLQSTYRSNKTKPIKWGYQGYTSAG